MKKIMNKMNFAIIALMTSLPAFAAEKDFNVGTDMCELIKSLQNVFHILRAAAFIGAAFFIAGWAWSYIVNAGDKDKGGTVEDLRKKGTSLLVGFSLLFLIGVVLSFIMSAAGLKLVGCTEFTGNW